MQVVQPQKRPPASLMKPVSELADNSALAASSFDNTIPSHCDVSVGSIDPSVSLSATVCEPVSEWVDISDLVHSSH